ncbi:hypothetical protein OF83DRAFT_939679 [Amylostereum chailletii]|nr:hypothetical protein OF83DRAFT_939679 [Amylostereum chailletii]
MHAITPLPPYPSSRARSSLSPSQRATLNAKISRALHDTLALPPPKRDTPAAIAFVSSYARDVAQEALQSVIWSNSEPKSEGREEQSIRARTLLLAERLAASFALPLNTLLDLTIAYSAHPSRLRSLLSTAFDSNPSLLTDLATSALPAFTAVLSSGSSSGLYGLRKAAHCLFCFLRPSPLSAQRVFAKNKAFHVALARAYDAGLNAAAQSYGGLHLPPDGPSSRTLDEWERIFLETKVALLDTFHVLFKSLINELAHATGPALAAETERTFDIIFALHELPAAPAASSSTPSTAFLNRPMLADYQHAYDLSRLLKTTLAKAAADDARLEYITVSLRNLDGDDGQSTPGALKFLLGSGAAPGIDIRGRRPQTSSATTATPTAAVSGPSSSATQDVLDLQISEVRGILPDHPPDYIRSLLAHFGNVERVVEALLDGTAPPQDQIAQPAHIPADEYTFTKDRANVFDEQEMDLNRVHVGKKSGDASTVLKDRTFMEQMKADILRRAEETSDSEEEIEFLGVPYPQDKGKAYDAAFEEELDDLDTIRVDGDGEESGASEDEENDSKPPTMSPETVLELAYIADQKVFERDAATRRSKDRAVLREQTGWADEQIEGWRSMLERNPKQKERMLQKHEFSGNRPLPSSSTEPSRSGTPHEQHSRGQGRGRGGRGRGRGTGRGGRGGGQGQGTEQRDRAWKDKNKASRGNHDRKRGHDKKMNRAGGPG